jgi:glycerate kinase
MTLRVVVAPDSFGTTLTAAGAAAAIARGWSSARPHDIVVAAPQSDGGPGFIDCLAGTGVVRATTVAGPLGDPVTARWRVDGDTAYVESAQACGLHLVGVPTADSALRASSTGLGELIAAVVEADPVRRLVVGLGGSATTDGGAGLLEALGGPRGAAHSLAGVEVVAATDVDNPLNGPTGAAAVFAPQKGADPPTVEILAARLAGIGAELDRFAGRAVTVEPGAGAAGGIGAVLLALGAHRASGADLVAQITGLQAALEAADVVITGEGRLDEQTPRGKVVARVAAATPPRAQVIALVGDAVPAGRALREELGLDVIESLVDHAGLEAALHDAEAVLAALAALVAAVVE